MSSVAESNSGLTILPSAFAQTNLKSLSGQCAPIAKLPAGERRKLNVEHESPQPNVFLVPSGRCQRKDKSPVSASMPKYASSPQSKTFAFTLSFCNNWLVAG